MYSQELKKLIKEAKARSADLCIGKIGINEGVLNEIKRRLDYHKIIKVKINYKEVEDRREFARKVAELVGAKLIEVRGYTFILAKNDSGGKNKDKGSP